MKQIRRLSSAQRLTVLRSGSGVNRPDRQFHNSSNSAPRVSGSSERRDPVNIYALCWASEALTLRTCVPKPCPHALRNEIPLPLGDRPQDCENELSGGCVGVHLLAQRNELNVESVECLQRSAQVRHRTAETIKAPADHHVKTTGMSVFHEAIQRGSGILLAGDTVINIGAVNFPAPTLAIVAEFSCLHLRVLPVTHRRNSRIDCCQHLPRSAFITSNDLQSHVASIRDLVACRIRSKSLCGAFSEPLQSPVNPIPSGDRNCPERPVQLLTP